MNTQHSMQHPGGLQLTFLLIFLTVKFSDSIRYLVKTEGCGQCPTIASLPALSQDPLMSFLSSY